MGIRKVLSNEPLLKQTLSYFSPNSSNTFTSRQRKCFSSKTNKLKTWNTRTLNLRSSSQPNTNNYWRSRLKPIDCKARTRNSIGSWKKSKKRWEKCTKESKTCSNPQQNETKSSNLSLPKSTLSSRKSTNSKYKAHNTRHSRKTIKEDYHNFTKKHFPPSKSEHSNKTKSKENMRKFMNRITNFAKKRRRWKIDSGNLLNFWESGSSSMREKLINLRQDMHIKGRNCWEKQKRKYPPRLNITNMKYIRWMSRWGPGFKKSNIPTSPLYRKHIKNIKN